MSAKANSRGHSLACCHRSTTRPVVSVDPPALHLHPRGQMALGRILAEAAARGLRVVVETHSPLIIRAAQVTVERGQNAPDPVGLRWLSRDEETGWGWVELPDLDSNGAFGE